MEMQLASLITLVTALLSVTSTIALPVAQEKLVRSLSEVEEKMNKHLSLLMVHPHGLLQTHSIPTENASSLVARAN
jgi:hypothetical protein